jgi:amino acid transporter
MLLLIHPGSRAGEEVQMSMQQESVPATEQPPLSGDGLKREVSRLGLLWASEGSVIGAGWLFAALLALTIAGPAAVFAWVIGTLIIVLLGLVYAELGGMFPVSGGGALFPQYAFGSLAGGSFAWFGYIQAAAYAPIEVIAAIQYMHSMSWGVGLYDANNSALTGSGMLVAVGLLIVFLIINLVGIRWVERANNLMTTIKVAVPLLAVLALMFTAFHPGNFTAGGGFFPSGVSIPKALMSAIAVGGIVFAFTGFEQATQIGGESRNPKRDIPFAVIGSIVIAGIIYILVQIAFIAALDPAKVLQYQTWANLGNYGDLSASPLATVAVLAGLTWLAWTFRAMAVISPGACGLIYLTATSRLSYGMSRDGYIPSAFEQTSKKTKIPVFSLIIAFVLGVLFLLPFPSFGKLVGVVTSATVLMYVGAPLALGALRMNGAHLPRSYSLPAATILAPLAFILSTLIVYWAGWQTYSTLMAAIIVGYALMLLSRLFRANVKAPQIDWASAKWLFPYLAGLGVISYFGGFGPGGIIGGIGPFSNVLVGGGGQLPLYWDVLVVTVFSLVIYYGAMATRLSRERVDEYVKASSEAVIEATEEAAPVTGSVRAAL